MARDYNPIAEANARLMAILVANHDRIPPEVSLAIGKALAHLQESIAQQIVLMMAQLRDSQMKEQV